jgi:hypothetical protein
VVTASLSNGASVQAHFKGIAAPQIAPLTGMLYLAQGAVFNWNPEAIVLTGGVPAPGQQVAWTANNGLSVVTQNTMSDSQGMATGQLVAGPLPPTVTVQVNACLPGGTPGGAGCTAFVVASVHPEVAGLLPVNGAGQVLSAEDTPSPVVLRVLDAAGHPMAGGIVNFYETLREWTPDCPASWRCPGSAVLATTSVQAISDADGLVTLVPLSQGGVPTRLEVLAVTGDTATVAFEIERHP